MLSKNAIKFINSLKIKKYRQQYQAFIVEGEKSVAELLNSPFEVKSIYCLENWAVQNSTNLRSSGAELFLIDEADLLKISDLSTPNKVLAVAGIPDSHELSREDLTDMVLALDGIRDPGNMGTILRTADWFGIQNVACSLDCVDVYSTKVVQSTMGSFARVNVVYMDLERLVSMATGFIPIYGALLNGPLLTDKKFIKPGILIIGNESRGISPSLIPLITDPVFIPPFYSSGSHSYHAESLNASMANAIICYEIRKQLSENKF
jgi:RNA methyltransferase, TrmH family